MAVKPNILLIICDDLAYGDLGCYGNQWVRTPHLNRLALQGTRFTRYCSGPLSTPARAALMSGRYAYRTRAIDTYLGRSMIDPEERTLPQVLADAGYSTGLFGKWHLGDCYPMRPHDLGFQEALYHTGGGLEQPANIGRRSYFSPDLMHNGYRQTSQGYCTDVFTDAAIHWISQHQQQHPQQPFYAHVAFNAPHTPLQIGEQWVRTYRQQPDMAEANARLYGMVENIDYNVGRLLSSLEQYRCDDNTIVIFTSDHGPHFPPLRFNAGLRAGKGSVYEGGLRVPLILRRPGQTVGGDTCDILSAPIDLMPTLAGMCQAKVPDDRTIDGIDLCPWLLGNSMAPHPARSVFMQWHRGDVPQARRNAAVITREYKLLWPQTCDPELYDLQKDPGETNNLINSNLNVAQMLINSYDRWFADVSSERGPGNYDPPRIILDSEHEAQTYLTWQDWRLYQPRSDERWKVEMPGYWLIRVAKPESFRVSVDMPALTKPMTVHVRCGPVHVFAKVNPGERAIAFDGLDLPQGDFRLEAYLGDTEPELGVIQVLVESCHPF